MTAFHVTCGDALDVLPTLSEASVDCVVTSPPYWGLRDYGTGVWQGGSAACDHAPTSGLQGKNGDRPNRSFSGATPHKLACPRCGAQRIDKQIGIEWTTDEYVGKLVVVFREIRRILKAQGTLWLNLGDCYAGSWGAQSREHTAKHAPNTASLSANQVKAAQIREGKTGCLTRTPGLKPKDLVGIPWRVALALQADGWYLRSDIVWSKPNPMPESAYDRCTKSHDYLFMLAKNGKPLLWRHRDTREWSTTRRKEIRWRHRDTGEEAVADPHDAEHYSRINVWRSFDYYFDADAVKEPASPDTHPRYARGRSATHKWADGGPGNQTLAKSFTHLGKPSGRGEGPTALDKVGRYSQPPGVNPKAAANASGSRQNVNFSAAVRESVEMRNKRSVWTISTFPTPEAHFATFPIDFAETCILAGCPPGGIVLDPFSGAATTGLACLKLGRRYIGIELNPDYVTIGQERARKYYPLLIQEAV